MYEIKYSLILLVTIKTLSEFDRKNIHGDCMPITNVVCLHIRIPLK